MNYRYAMHLLSDFGRTTLRDATVGEFHDDIPEDLRDDCKIAGEWLGLDSAAAQAHLDGLKRPDRVEDDGGPTAEDLGHAPGEEARDSKLKAVIYTRFSPRPETL